MKIRTPPYYPYYPPPYERHIWHDKHANTDMISKTIQSFDWDKALLDKSTEEKASILTKLFSTS